LLVMLAHGGKMLSKNFNTTISKGTQANSIVRASPAPRVLQRRCRARPLLQCRCPAANWVVSELADLVELLHG
jgi:hypothetical protein